MYTAHVTERAHFLRSPTKATDWLVLTTDADSEAIVSGLPSWQDRVSLVLVVVISALFVVNLLAPRGSLLKSICSVLWIVVLVLDAPLLYRRFRRNYRSPQKS